MNRALWTLAVQGMRRKKRSSILLLLILSLSFAFAVVSLSVTGSISRTNEEYRYNTYGAWYGAIPSGKETDEAFLRGCEWLEQLGISRCYGMISGDSGFTGIGTMDEAFLEIGRISLLDGHFPKHAGEIAMEADVLSAMGYDYSIGQEITVWVNFPAGEHTVSVQQSFTLCGVLREYSDLWVLKNNTQDRRLNGAMITEADAQKLLEAAEAEVREMQKTAAEAGKAPEIALDQVTPQYFFTVRQGSEADMVRQVNNYLSSSRTGIGGSQFCVNSIAYHNSYKENYDYFYVGLIFSVTLLSTICVYAIQLQEQVRQIAVFRSIGITKRQLRRMMLYETLCLCVPAIVLGLGGGALGTWAVLWLTVYSGSTLIQVDIPFSVLLPVMLTWLLSVFFARLAVFQIALRAPLTGRFCMESRKARRYRNLRKVTVIVLSCLLCAVMIFTVLESLHPSYLKDYWSKAPSYVVYAISDPEGRPRTVTERKTEQMARIPGIADVQGLGELSAELSFDGMDGNALAAAFREAAGNYPDSMTVTLYAIDAEGWEGTFDLEAAGVDMDAFQRGEQVALCFPIDLDGSVSYPDGEQSYGEIGLSAGDSIVLSVYADAAEPIGGTTAQVGGILYFSPRTNNRLLAGVYDPYTVVCSEAFLANLLSALEPGHYWGKYLTGSTFGYGRVYVYADLNAEYLSTDSAMAELCAENDLLLSNRREEYGSYIQEHLQTLILLFSSGGCIALVLLLILGNTLTLEAEHEKRSYGILQSLGMSTRQMKVALFRKSLMRGGIAAGCGWLIYGAYLVVTAWIERKQRLDLLEEAYSIGALLESQIRALWRDGADLRMLLLLTAAGVVLILLVSRIAKRGLFRVDLMTKLRDEH